MAILMLADVKKYLRIDGSDADADVQRAMASAEAVIRTATGRVFDSTNALAKECALMLTAQFFDTRGGVQENKYSALDFGINNLLTTLQYWPEEDEA